MSEQPIIRIKGLDKTYSPGTDREVHALSGIDLTINEGDIFGIIGLSGAGKSTLVRCMNFLEKPTAGTVEVNGQDLATLTPKELRTARRSIGMIFQQFNLLMQRTALGNICFPLEIAGVDKAAAKERAMEMLRIVGLEEKANAYPSQLSGGQKQRAAIARALATNPKVLLCDEATSALDPTTTQSLLALLREINQKFNITIVIITHEMSVIEAICSRVAIIDKSQIAEMGDVKEVFARPKSDIARKLVFPGGENNYHFEGGTDMIRIVFDGLSAFEPVISDMVLTCKAPINIMFANTKELDGKAVGQMLLQLPEDPAAVQRITAYLTAHEINFEEVHN
ncbi:MAG: ATP-binding cassette domain-containing protein [Clostridia bacterium]|nr:ATP-binding cassette domain-containing protein [Clostridia bacterium]